MANKVLEVEFRAKDSMSAALKAAGLNAEQTARKLKEINSASKSSQSSGKSDGEKGGLEGLNDRARKLEHSFGEERVFNKLLQGGLVGFAGDKLGEATAKAVELKNAFNEGKIGAAGVAVELGKSLPLIGGFVSAGQNIRELFTGEKAAIDKVNRAAEVQNQLTAYSLSLYEQQKKRIQEIGDILFSIGNRKTNAGLEGFTLEQQQRAQEAANRLRELDKKREAELDQSQKEALKQREEIGKKENLDPEERRRAIAQINAKAGKDQADIRKRFDEAEKAEREASGAEEQAWTKKHLEDSQRLVDQHELELSSAQAKARADRLKALGLSGQAELVEIEQQAKEKKAALLRQYDEEKKTTASALQPALAGNLRRRLAEVDAEASQQQQDAAFKHQQDTAKRLRDGQQKLLDDAAGQATKPADKLEAKRKAEAFRLQNEMRDRAKELREVLNDPLASDKEKQSATDQFKQWTQQAGKQFDRATLGPAAEVAHLANLSESMTLTGVSAAGAERRAGNDPQVKTAQHTEASVKLQTDFNSKMDQLVRIAQQGAQAGESNPLFDY